MTRHAAGKGIGPKLIRGWYVSYIVKCNGYPVVGYNSKRLAIASARKIQAATEERVVVARYAEKCDRRYHEEAIVWEVSHA